MVHSLFSAARLAGAAGVITSKPPLSLADRKPITFGSRATIRLVDALLATDDNPDVYRDVLLQLDTAQRHVDYMPEDAAETGYLQTIIDAVPLCGKSPLELQDCLADYAHFLERDARLEEALDVLVLNARTYGIVLPPKMFIECALRAGHLNRLLARWDRATACYSMAAEAAQALGDQALVLQSRLGCGAVYLGQGELTAARASAELVMREAGRLGLSDIQTLAYWELGNVLRFEGVVAESLQAVYYAFQLTQDSKKRMHALHDVGLGLAAIGAYDESRNVLETVLDSEHDTLLRTSALIGLMEVESAVGNRVAFERRCDEADDLRGRMPPDMAVDHRYKLGIGLARFGQCHRARAFLDEALMLARANRLLGWCDKIEFQLGPVAKAG